MLSTLDSATNYVALSNSKTTTRIRGKPLILSTKGRSIPPYTAPYHPSNQMTTIHQLKRKPRPLKKTYSPTEPYTATRDDEEDGSIRYVIYDERPESYRFVCSVSDDYGQHPYCKHDAEQIVRGLNLLVQYGKENLPKIKE